MNTIVTGGSGFIGSNLIKKLLNTYQSIKIFPRRQIKGLSKKIPIKIFYHQSNLARPKIKDFNRKKD